MQKIAHTSISSHFYLLLQNGMNKQINIFLSFIFLHLQLQTL